MRSQIAPGAFISELPGGKFKRCRVTVNLIAPSRRENATALAMLPQVLCRRCEAVPDALGLSRLLCSLYGAELSAESQTIGANRVVSLSISGLKSEYGLDGEDLAAKYVDLLCNALFSPKLSGGCFEPEDVAIEKGKRAEILRGELNDKRGYCRRQARGKLFGASPFGVESSGYLEDVHSITPESLFAAYAELLRSARLEAMACGADGGMVGERVRAGLAGLAGSSALSGSAGLAGSSALSGSAALAGIGRAPEPLAAEPALSRPASFERYAEPLPTVQGKLTIACASGVQADARMDAVARVASFIYGGMHTSRLFKSAREKESLCYYCQSSYDFFSGTLTVESGVDHANAGRAAEVILGELAKMQREDVEPEELLAAKRGMRVSFGSMKDRPAMLMNWALAENLKGTNRTLDEMSDMVDSVTAAEAREAILAFCPAVEYVIVDEKGGE